MHYLLFSLVCLLWGSNFILMKKAGLSFGPVGVGAWRVMGGAAALMLLSILLRRSWRVRRPHILPLAVVVVLGYAWPFVMQPSLINAHGSALMGMMVCLVPLATILVSVPLLRQAPTAGQVVGVLGGLGFMAVLFSDKLDASVPLTDLLLAASIPIGYSISNTTIKRSLADVPALELTGLSLLLAGVFLTPLTVTTETIQPNEHFPLALAALLWMGVVSTGLATFMLYYLVQRRGPLFAGMVTYIIPLIAVAWGYLDGEHISTAQLLALLGVLAMVGVVQYGSERATPSTARMAPCEAVSASE